MKTEFEAADIEAIAQRVIELLKPVISNNGNVEDEIYNIDQTSEFLKTSKGQIYQWVNNSKHGLGTFPYLKTGKQLRFSRIALIQWMESNKKR